MEEKQKATFNLKTETIERLEKYCRITPTNKSRLVDELITGYLNKHMRPEIPAGDKVDLEPVKFWMNRRNFMVFGKPRQVGVSTFIIDHATQSCLETDGLRVLLLYYKSNAAARMSSRVMNGPEIRSHNKLKIEFQNGSVISFASVNSRFSNLGVFDLVIIDEFMGSQEDLNALNAQLACCDYSKLFVFTSDFPESCYYNTPEYYRMKIQLSPDMTERRRIMAGLYDDKTGKMLREMLGEFKA